MSALSKTIGIIGAMDIEINALMKEFTDVKKETVGGTEYIMGTYTTVVQSQLFPELAKLQRQSAQTL